MPDRVTGGLWTAGCSRGPENGLERNGRWPWTARNPANFRRGADARDIARKNGVSERMAQYRLDVTGVERQNQAAIKKNLTQE